MKMYPKLQTENVKARDHSKDLR